MMAITNSAKIITRVLYQTVIISVDYTLLGSLQNQLKLKQYGIRDVVYEDVVHLHVWVEDAGTLCVASRCFFLIS